jgi:hypothetical protein
MYLDVWRRTGPQRQAKGFRKEANFGKFEACGFAVNMTDGNLPNNIAWPRHRHKGADGTLLAEVDLGSPNTACPKSGFKMRGSRRMVEILILVKTRVNRLYERRGPQYR